MSKRDHPQDDRAEAAGAEQAAEAPADQTAAAATPPPDDRQQIVDALQAARAERDDYLSRLQRVSADYLNYQKRVQRDVEAAREFANEDLIKALLPALDDLERAIHAASQTRDEMDPFFLGVQLVRDKLLEILGRFGLTAIDSKGEPFDPALHAAMMRQPSDSHPPNTVLSEYVKGYLLKGRTIRPAGVVVSAPPEEDDTADNDG